MLTRLVGDIHGRFTDYDLRVSADVPRGSRETPPPERSIQVGDFGIGFGSLFWHDRVEEFQKKNPQHRFIRGNHDDPARCRKMPGYIEDGTVEGDVMMIGGAWSIDHASRTEGVSWWRDEEVSGREFDRLLRVYEATKPRVMITHDCPTKVAWDMFIASGHSIGGYHQTKTRTGEYLQAMFDTHQPQEWYFGHWHVTRQFELYGTKFQCLGELDYIDVEL